MNDAERIEQIADELMAYQPLIDIPFERFYDVALAVVTLGYVSKEEIEQLKDNRNGWRNRAWEYEKENAKLQKQVDEQDQEIDRLEKVVHDQAEQYYDLEQRTAKEILQKIMNIIKKSDGFLAEEVVRIMAKQKGVEVEE